MLIFEHDKIPLEHVSQYWLFMRRTIIHLIYMAGRESTIHRTDGQQR